MGISGYEVLREEFVREHSIEALLLRHLSSGCQVLRLGGDDVNKVFMIFFLTPPSDSTGLPHILEHMVLCGSKRFPLKEPFRELLKGSLQTFLNAFTYPDRTCYPVASKHKADLLNLAQVYLDAVFNPLLRREAFYQEAWHVVPEALKMQGVVYSEMKGAYSSPEQLLETLSLRSLFQGHIYGFDSGGDPKEIPFLEYEALTRFHSRYYCPMNAKVLLYGDLDLREALELLEPFLIERSAGEEVSVPEISSGAFGGRHEGSYQAEAGEGLYVSQNWCVGESTDPQMNIIMRILEEAILGGAGAPLRKRLIDAGIGDDLVSEGLDAELRYMTFHVGMKGVPEEKERKFWDEVSSCLEDLARNGLPKEHLDAAINRVEFWLREANANHLPKGLVLCLRAATFWAYGADPLSLLRFESPLKEAKDSISKTANLLSDLIKEKFLKNPWNSQVILRPSSKRVLELEMWERSICRDRLSVGRIEYEEGYKRFRRYSETPDPEEARLRVPRLRLSELSKEPEEILCEWAHEGNAIVLKHPMSSSGIVYLDLCLPLKGLEEEEAFLVPVLSRCLLEMGTKKRDLSELSALIGKVTGGLWPEIHAFRGLDGRVCWFLILRAKVLGDMLSAYFDLLKELLLDRAFNDNLRLLQILKEEVARIEEAFVKRGHWFAATRARSHFGRQHMFTELCSGISYARFLKVSSVGVDAWARGLADRLSMLWGKVLNRKGALVNITGEGLLLDKASQGVKSFLRELEEQHLEDSPDPSCSYGMVEGFGIPSQVFFLAKALRIPNKAFDGSWLCGIKYLRTVYLWEEVRMKGGAYGAYASVDWANNTLSLSSYRDPNPQNTLRCFDAAGIFLERNDMSQDELERTIIATIGELDRHMEPQEKGFVGLQRFIRGEDKEFLRKVRQEVLATSKGAIKEFGRLFSEASGTGSAKVLGPFDGVREILKGLGAEADPQLLA